MSELDQAPPPEDTPTTADTPEGTGTPDQPQIPEGYIPEGRYKEVQSWATRLAQEKAQLDDPDYRRQLLEQWGYQIGDPEPEPDDSFVEDPTQAELTKLREQVQQLSEWQQGLTTQQQQDQALAAFRAEADPKLKAMGVPEGIHDLVTDLALQQMPFVHTPQGAVPDLEGAVKAVQEFVLSAAEMPEVRGQLLKGWQGTKRTTHRVSPVGEAGSQVPNLDDRQERVDWMTSQLVDEP